MNQGPRSSRAVAVAALIALAGQCPGAVAAVLQGAPATSPAHVVVDRRHQRAHVVVVRPSGEVVISLDPLMNLLLHTMNVYDLLGLHGRGYALKSDSRVQEAVDPAVYAAIARKENYFALAEDGRDFYAPTMATILAHESYLQYPRAKLLYELAPEPLNKALVRMWDGFYQGYWANRFEALLGEFEQMNRNMRWDETLSRMERLAGRSWRGRMYVFAVEATADSAITHGKNVCIGTVEAEGDAGFVHEGFHLLLDEEWAKSPPIQQFMAAREFHDPFWREDWAGKYEQALVLALDHHLRHRHRRPDGPDLDRIRRSFEGCGVGDLFEVAWPLVSDYVRTGQGNLDDLMWEMVRRGETRPALEEQQ